MVLGNCKTYEPGENLHKDNILYETIVPANISKELKNDAQDLALKIVEFFKGVGVFCIEMFVDEEFGLLINEVAPRVHNSGHHTIESCITSQFEKHIRAISGLPLGSTKLLTPAKMVNLLGPTDFQGSYEIEIKNLGENTFIHDYNKSESRPKRKMGHITQIGHHFEELQNKVILKPSKGKIIEIRVGSDSDLPKIKEAFTVLEELGIPFEIRILSAHRTPHAIIENALSLEKGGFFVSLCAAGGSAHLAGMTASETPIPVNLSSGFIILKIS